MIRLVVNGIAGARSSRGVARYAAKVISTLEWPDPIERLRPGPWAIMDKARELTFRAGAGAVVWSPTHRGPVFSANHVVTVHDCINVESMYAGTWKETAVRQLTQRMLDNAARVISISHATRNALLRNYRIEEGRIRIIQSSCEEDLSSIDLRLSPGGIEMAAALREAGPYALMVTNALPHKNTALACTALSLSSFALDGGRLRVVGSLSPEAYRISANAGLQVDVEANVDNIRLAALYRNAAFVLSPSKAEGHNLVIAEALGCGAPVVCSDIAAHREFYDGRALMFDPDDLDAAVDRIEAVLQEPVVSPSRASGLSWSQVGAAYRQVFEAVGSCS